MGQQAVALERDLTESVIATGLVAKGISSGITKGRSGSVNNADLAKPNESYDWPKQEFGDGHVDTPHSSSQSPVRSYSESRHRRWAEDLPAIEKAIKDL